MFLSTSLSPTELIVCLWVVLSSQNCVPIFQQQLDTLFSPTSTCSSSFCCPRFRAPWFCAIMHVVPERGVRGSLRLAKIGVYLGASHCLMTTSCGWLLEGRVRDGMCEIVSMVGWDRMLVGGQLEKGGDALVGGIW